MLQNASAQDREYVTRLAVFLDRLAGLERCDYLAADAAAPPAAAAMVGDLVLLVPMAGLIEPNAELERLKKRITKSESDIKILRTKLANENFVRNAPAAVVDQDKARLAELDSQIERMRRHAETVRKLL
jgi:valyl-tRNA synthetase